MPNKYAIWANNGSNEDLLVCDNIYNKGWAIELVKGLEYTLGNNWRYTIEVSSTNSRNKHRPTTFSSFPWRSSI